MRKLIRRALLAGVPAAAAVAVFAGSAAQAQIVPTVIFTPAATGVAGIAERPNVVRLADGDKMTGVRFTSTLGAPLTYSPGQVAWGAALCEQQGLANPVTAAAIIFARWNGAVFNIYFLHSTSTSCIGAFNGAAGVPVLMDQIPLGHRWFGAVTQGALGDVHFTSGDLTTLQTAQETFGGFNTVRFTRAFIGTAADTSQLTEPANALLAHAGSAYVRDTAGGWTKWNRNALTRLQANLVKSSVNGDESGVLLRPAHFGQARFDLLRGHFSN